PRHVSEAAPAPTWRSIRSRTDGRNLESGGVPYELEHAPHVQRRGRKVGKVYCRGYGMSNDNSETASVTRSVANHRIATAEMNGLYSPSSPQRQGGNHKYYALAGSASQIRCHRTRSPTCARSAEREGC